MLRILRRVALALAIFGGGPLVADPIDFFADAPSDIRTWAEVISSGEVPQGITPEAAQAGFGQPLPRVAPQARHTLLRHAVLVQNVEAARALIAAGADPHFNGDEMPFLATAVPAEGPRVWWPDYSQGNALLRLWLEAGGDPNVINLNSYGLGPLLLAVPGDNLEAMLILIEAGADPWYRMPAPDDRSADPYRYSSFYQRHANASPGSTEIIFRIAEAGLYRGGTPEDHADVLGRYEGLLGDYVTSSGPSDRATMWRLQKVMELILPALGHEPAGRLTTLMAVPDTAEHGGFWLAPGQLQSPQGEAHLVTPENQRGKELWDDR